VDLFASFATCADFEAHPCLITAVDQCTAVDVGVPSDGGAGGAPSTPSEAGSGGSDGLTNSNAGAGGA
jgi:hypothetical protein